MANTARTDQEEDEQTSNKTKITQVHQHQQHEVDRISQLPDDILHPIMSLLTLKESCITSSLSKRWRTLFPSIPSLNFDNLSFDYSSVRDHVSWDDEINIGCWLESVRDILECRRAPVRACTIRSAYLDEYREDFGNIILFLCNDGIQELTIYNMAPHFSKYDRHFTIPSCFYFCPTPTRIELSKCFLKVPPKFGGLRLLNVLKIEDCVVGDGDVQRLILGCPDIERLTLKRCHRLRNLAVDADKLAVLDVTTHKPLAVSIVNAPRLESVTVRFIYGIDNGIDIDDGGNDTDESEVSRLVGLLESIGNVQNLLLEFQNTHMKSVAVPVTPRSLLPKMKRLTLKMQPNDTFKVSIVSCLLNSCPNLEDLVIGDNDWYDGNDDRIYPGDSVLNYWDRQIPSDCMRNTLSAVTVYLKDGCYYWMIGFKLLKFLLNNACVLKNMVICGQQEEDLKCEWVERQLQRASPDAVVELNSDRGRVLYGPACSSDLVYSGCYFQ